MVRYRPRTTSLTYGWGFPTARPTVACETPASEIASPTRFDPGGTEAARRGSSRLLVSTGRGVVTATRSLAPGATTPATYPPSQRG